MQELKFLAASEEHLAFVFEERKVLPCEDLQVAFALLRRLTLPEVADPRNALKGLAESSCGKDRAGVLEHPNVDKGKLD